jgi:hypothetical protein
VRDADDTLRAAEFGRSYRRKCSQRVVWGDIADRQRWPPSS